MSARPMNDFQIVTLILLFSHQVFMLLKVELDLNIKFFLNPSNEFLCLNLASAMLHSLIHPIRVLSFFQGYFQNVLLTSEKCPQVLEVSWLCFKELSLDKANDRNSVVNQQIREFLFGLVQ